MAGLFRSYFEDVAEKQLADTPEQAKSAAALLVLLIAAAIVVILFLVL